MYLHLPATAGRVGQQVMTLKGRSYNGLLYHKNRTSRQMNVQHRINTKNCIKLQPGFMPNNFLSRGVVSLQVKKIKLEFKVVSPSCETIHWHVVDLKSIGMSPTKRGSDGSIPSLHYKSLCMAFATKTHICQLNTEVSTHKKQIQWIKTTLQCLKQEASVLWKRLSWDSALDTKATSKIEHAEEQHVKWTTYSNLELGLMDGKKP